MDVMDLIGPAELPQVLLANLVMSALLAVLLIVLLMPLLRRYALARPNARSSHRIPTPQGGGIAVVAAALLPMAAILMTAAPDFNDAWGSAQDFRNFCLVAVAAIGLSIVGAFDDIRPLPVAPRLLLQFLAVAVVVATGQTILPFPAWAEFALLVLAGLWFVNLVNFMDGLDWITVAEMVPVTAGIVLLGGIVDMPASVTVMAACLCGALLGFALFNKPVARLFLGDVGSLPIGLLVGWMLLHVAAAGTVAAALLLPLYYLMDATITLLKRLARRERVWEAHRSHFYQQATDNGFSALAVSGHVFAVNLVLAALAAASLAWPSPAVQITALTAGGALVGALLRRFSRPRYPAPTREAAR
jgi:UDP-N-acetylmuramyl pentapeptide phosphotransferase/UDP-N-acetylglucosamine-1-phosphate transferase